MQKINRTQHFLLLIADYIFPDKFSSGSAEIPDFALLLTYAKKDFLSNLSWAAKLLSKLLWALRIAFKAAVLAFTHAGVRLWNSLPVQLRSPEISYERFKRQLKEHLFGEPWTRRSVTSDIGRLRFTYLLTHLLILFNGLSRFRYHS